MGDILFMMAAMRVLGFAENGSGLPQWEGGSSGVRI
jgi:hypothetical protein